MPALQSDALLVDSPQQKSKHSAAAAAGRLRSQAFVLRARFGEVAPLAAGVDAETLQCNCSRAFALGPEERPKVKSASVRDEVRELPRSYP